MHDAPPQIFCCFNESLDVAMESKMELVLSLFPYAVFLLKVTNPWKLFPCLWGKEEEISFEGTNVRKGEG